MTALEAVVRQRLRPHAGLPLTLARALLTPLCVAALTVAASRDLLASLIGESWLPRIQLHLQFNSLCFLLVFLPCTLVLYALYRRTAAANWILTAAGLALYATAGVIYLVPLLFTCMFDYAVGAYLARADDDRRRRIAFTASVAVQLFLLCAFKYTGWLSTELAGVLAVVGISASFGPIALPLPPGISFYTFHTISYTADIYRHKFQPRRRLIDYVTFVGFFPQLIAGPIARAAELLPQIAAVRPAISLAAAEEALWLIAWGLFKKIALADNFGLLVRQAATDLHDPNHGGVGYLFMVAFAGQIYCDFSAYTDIARGVAKLFGIELPRNFLTPYFAVSPSEFWQRWHISLSRWLRDYLYIPLGGEREGRLKTLRNLAITMFLGGLWHGAGVGFIAWGLYHGGLLVLYRLLPVDQLLQRHFKQTGTALAAMLMFGFVCFGWLFFRAPSGDLLPLIGSLAYWPPFSTRLVLLAVPLIVTEWIGYRRGTEFVDVYAATPWWMRPLLFVAVFYGIIFFGGRQQNEFIYFQF
jgi:D-alanyl-lipoteichoic acid acyltransferase DltB (MBOAT superfamily)